ncbi:MAG TPA: hypothetical protein VEV20_02685 [Burkholderiales bacterium]|nr:hypothetical protein [Burkholderiales bacterium]
MADPTVIAVDGGRVLMIARRADALGGRNGAVMRMIWDVAMTDALRCRDRDMSNRRTVQCMLAERHRDRGVTLHGQPEDHE